MKIASDSKPLAAVAVCAVAVCAVAACGTVRASTTSATSGSPRQQAEADAAANLSSFTAPPGAKRLSRVPAGATALDQAPLTAGQVDDTSYWQATGAPNTELSWVKAHLGHGFTLLASGTEGGFYMTPYDVGTVPDSGPRLWYDEFSLPAVKGKLPVRVLVVSAASAGAGQTVIRVDAQDAWSMTRTAAQRVPSAVTSVIVSQVRTSGPISLGDTRTVTSASLVRKIVDLANGLPLYATGAVWSCPAQLAPVLRLVFRDGASVQATATVDAGGCGTVSLVIGNHSTVVLGGGVQFQHEVSALAALSGVNPGGPMKSVTS